MTAHLCHDGVMKKERKRLTLRLPSSIYEGIQALANLNYCSKNQIILQACQNEINRSSKEILKELERQNTEN